MPAGLVITWLLLIAVLTALLLIAAGPQTEGLLGSIASRSALREDIRPGLSGHMAALAVRMGRVEDVRRAALLGAVVVHLAHRLALRPIHPIAAPSRQIRRVDRPDPVIRIVTNITIYGAMVVHVSAGLGRGPLGPDVVLTLAAVLIRRRT